MKTILVTGAAGFIGFHTTKKLLERGNKVIGVDNLNDYYDINLKKDRLKELKKLPKNQYNNFTFIKLDIATDLDKIKNPKQIDVICHLAAQAGVRYSIENPIVYQKSNSLGTLQIFEFARHKKIWSVIYASSSSVYGNNKNAPFKETEQIDKPVSFYAATKKSNELTAYTYHHLYGINMTGLRLFTVYGPWGRPDMAPFIFTNKISKNQPIKIFNHGKMKRDFTYIDDIVQGIIAAIDTAHKHPYEIFNIARGETITLSRFIKSIEKATKKEAKKIMLPMQAGDVPLTSGNIDKAKSMLNYKPTTSIDEGIEKFVKWYNEYY